MGLKIYIDGKYYQKEDAKVSVFDHGLLYGDGVFEGIRTYDGLIFKLKEHIDRLYQSAHAIMLDIPMTKDEMIEAIKKTLRENEMKDAYIRLIVTRGIGDLGLDPRKCLKPTIVVITDKIKLYPQELYDKGLEIVTISTQRNNHESVNPQIKSLNYLNNILAKVEAINAGVEEAVMLNSEGYVAECTGDNIFLVRQQRLLTPPNEAGILEVMNLYSRIQLHSQDEPFTTDELQAEADPGMVHSIRQASFALPIEDRISLYAAMDRLSVFHKRLIYLLFFKDLTQSEVAEELGLTQKKVSRESLKALGRLKEVLGRKVF